METHPLIQIKQVSKRFGKQLALDHVDMSIPQGVFAILAGPDGAGKTTLMRILAGLLMPTEGKIAIADQTEIGYMPQRFGLYEDLTVLENLSLFANLYQIPKPQKMAKLDQLLQMMDLTPFTKRLAKYLSGGMKQKLGLACTLLHTPSLFLLDEPSVGVDPLSRLELWNRMREVQKEGATILWSTSYLDEAEKGDLVFLLHEGKLLYQGPPNALTKQAEGKVFQIDRVEGSKRNALSRLWKQHQILDGVIQANHIRVICDREKPEWTPCPPRFEDAYIALYRAKTKDPNGQILEEGSAQKRYDGTMIEAKELTKRFGSFLAVDKISFQIQSGEIFGLLGPNGAGKSTTFKMLCGLELPSSGKAYIQGIDTASAPSEARSKIGYMAQKFSLYGNLTVQQNLEFFSSIYNLSNKEQKLAIAEVSHHFQLEPFFTNFAQDLPAGCKQRLALACAVMHRPMILFLDEPTSGTDPLSRRRFWNYMKELSEQGCAILVSTHSMDEAEYCDRILLIHQSKELFIGTPADLKKTTQTATLEQAFIKRIEQENEHH